MAFARWDPLRDLLAIHEQLGYLVGTDAPGWTPLVDLYETPANFVLIADLPGVKRDQIEIHAEDSRVTIRGVRQASTAGADATEDDVRREQYHRVERGHGRFARSFALPETIAVEAITADLKDGLLTITMPKMANRGVTHIKVT